MNHISNSRSPADHVPEAGKMISNSDLDLVIERLVKLAQASRDPNVLKAGFRQALHASAAAQPVARVTCEGGSTYTNWLAKIPDGVHELYVASPLLAQVPDETLALKRIISECLAALGNGASSDPTNASVQYLLHAPAEIRAHIAKLKVAAEADAAGAVLTDPALRHPGPWRVGLFWSSSNLDQKVRCIAEGAEQIEEYEKREDFIQWLAAPYPAPARLAVESGKAGITWPESRRVGRREDMSPDGTLIVGLDNDNDVYIEVSGNRHGQWQSAAVEFCNGGGGGGHSSATRAALINLMTAMESDNEKVPHKAFPGAGRAGS